MNEDVSLIPTVDSAYKAFKYYKIYIFNDI